MSRLPTALPLTQGSVRKRLMLWNVCALGVILSLLGGIIRYTVRQNMMTLVDRDLLQRAQAQGGHHGPRGGGPPMSLVPLLLMPPPPDEGRRQEPDRSANAARMVRIDMADPLGRHQPWDAAAVQRTLKGRDQYSTIKVDGQPMRIYSKRMIEDGKLVGVIQFPYRLTDVNHSLNVLDRTLLALIPVALLLAGLGGALLTGRALRPVQSLGAAADRIGAEELSQRLPVSGDDEFSRLAATINRMLGRIEVSFAEREALVTRLELLIEQQRRFTADASHELKTPLTIIKANTSLLLQRPRVAADVREAIEDVDGAADTMGRLVQDLLLLACHDSGQPAPDRIPLPVHEVLERVIGRMARKECARVCLHEDGRAALVLANEDELARLWTNLLSNALRYTPQTGRIDVAVREEGDDVCVTIADTGSGIAPEHLPHLGERFYRIDASRARPDGGTGLGLSICRSIVQAHGGRMAIESDLGKGTTVTVMLPRATDAPEDE